MKNTKFKCHLYVQLSDRAEIIVQWVWLEVQAALFMYIHKMLTMLTPTHKMHIILCQSSTCHWVWLSTKIKHKAKQKNLLQGEFTFSMPKSDCQIIPSPAGLALCITVLCFFMNPNGLEKSVIKENHSCRHGSSIHCLPVAVSFRAVLLHLPQSNSFFSIYFQMAGIRK